MSYKDLLRVIDHPIRKMVDELLLELSELRNEKDKIKDLVDAINKYVAKEADLADAINKVAKEVKERGVLNEESVYSLIKEKLVSIERIKLDLISARTDFKKGFGPQRRTINVGNVLDGSCYITISWE